jgi:hypothetical protein
MKERILTLLHELEKKHDIRILIAVSYGSRSFGYASAESDWDVRFIYVNRPEWYFSITKTEDSLKLILDDEDIDMEGYDLRKALTLLAKTNPNESDWLHASDYLIINEDFLHAMRTFEAQCYNLHHAMYHFYSISLKHNQRYLEKEVTVKRFVYYMRGLLSCRWLEQHGSHPPVNVDELIDATLTDNETVREKAHHLLEIKRSGRSHDKAAVDEELADYMFGIQKYYEQLLPKYKDIKPQADYTAMSKYLMNVVLREIET